MKSHKDFIDLIDLGKSIIPFVIEDLEEDPGWVQVVLLYEMNEKGIISIDKIDRKVRAGVFQDNVEFWIDWWKRQNRENKLNRILKDT